MSFGIVLNEGDLRQMPADLRDGLLKWYFGRGDGAHPSGSNGTVTGPVPGPVRSSVPGHEENARVSFPEFVRCGLLSPGDAILCRALKRQRRGGAEPFIDAGKVVMDGTVEYRSRRYDVPSKLAVDVVNSNGGKTKALNGYDYIFVRSAKGHVPLSELRDQFLKRL